MEKRAEWAALTSAAHFPISGRHPAIENGTYTFCRSLIQPHSFPSYGVLHAFSCQVLSSSLGWLALLHAILCLENGNLTHIGDRQTCFHSLRKTASVWPTAATSMAMGDIGSPNHPLLPTRSPNYMARRRKALIYLFVRKLKLHS